jgi:hypothetical protein
MKLHALMIAAALAFAGTAFAQSGSNYGSSGSTPAASTSEKAPAPVHKKVVKAKKAHAHHHAHAMRKGHHDMHHASSRHHDMHARAHMDRHNTRAMGAGPSGPTTDLNAQSRENRMNSAYQDWLRLQRR